MPMLRKADLTPFWTTRQVITDGGDVPIPANSNGYVAVNIGTVTAFVNGFPINPPLVPGANGESIVVGGNFGEVLAEQNLEIIFAGAAGAKVFLAFKVYNKVC